MAFFFLIFNQFPFFIAIRILLIESMRRFFDRYAQLGYAAGGEDRLVSSIFPTPGFYVDVGCNHPTNYSNTFMLYKRGWHGINIDANAALIEMHKRIKPKDQSIFAAVAQHQQTLTYTEFEGETAMASLDPEFVRARLASGMRIGTELIMKTKTLTEILVQLGAPNRFELLNVDVEGLDLEVLRSLDFARFRPQMIIVEILGFDLENHRAEPIFEYLSAVDYRLAGYTHMNAVFMDRKVHGTDEKNELNRVT